MMNVLFKMPVGLIRVSLAILSLMMFSFKLILIFKDCNGALICVTFFFFHQRFPEFCQLTFHPLALLYDFFSVLYLKKIMHPYNIVNIIEKYLSKFSPYFLEQFML